MRTPYDLIHRWLNDEASPEDHQSLMQWLAQDPRHAEALIEQASDDAALRQQFLQQDVEQLAAGLFDVDPSQADDSPQDALIMREIIEEALKRRAEQEKAEADALAAASQSSRSDTDHPRHRPASDSTPREAKKPTGLIFDRVGIQVYRGQSTDKRPTVRRWAWAAVVLLAGVVVYLASGGEDAQPPQEPQAQLPTERTETPARARQVATIRQTHGAVGPETQAMQIGSRLEQGQTFALSAGLVELQLDRGAVVLAEAPFELEVLSDNGIRLNHGKIVATVPQSAVRFSIDTQTARVVDLGTEFGVEVDQTGSTSAAVFKGKVELRDTQASSVVQSLRIRRSLTLDAGWSASVTPDDGLSSNATAFDISQQAQFARSLSPDDLATLAYRRAVLATGPTAYWPMEESSQRRYNDWANTRGEMTLIQHGAIASVPGLFGQAARFTGDEDNPQYLDLASARDIPALNNADAYAISLWYFADQPHIGTLFSLIVPYDDLTSPGSHHAQVSLGTPSGDPISRAFHRSPPGPVPAGHELTDSEHYPLGRWNHVVLTVDPSAARFYINGMLIDQAADPAPLRGRVALRMGMLGGTLASHLEPRAFQGLLDEVVLYDRALTEEEIQTLAERPASTQPQ